MINYESTLELFTFSKCCPIVFLFFFVFVVLFNYYLSFISAIVLSVQETLPNVVKNKFAAL